MNERHHFLVIQQQPIAPLSKLRSAVAIAIGRMRLPTLFDEEHSFTRSSTNCAIHTEEAEGYLALKASKEMGHRLLSIQFLAQENG